VHIYRRRQRVLLAALGGSAAGPLGPEPAPTCAPSRLLDWVRRGIGADTAGVGFNPFRSRRRSAADYAMVAAALVVCAALVVWALLG
jgi:hypothetical protein